MTCAEQWVRDSSRASGSARALMFALARFAKGCVVVCTAMDLEREARISRPQLYRCLAWLEELREIERLMKHGENKRFRRYHLIGFCESPSLTQKCSVSYRKHGRVSDLRTPSLRVSSLLPFPRMVASQEECEECRGSGYRDFTILTHDGYPQRVAIPCTHEIAAIAGRWRLAETWQDQFLRPVLPSHPTERGAEQLTLAEYQERLRRDELKRQRERILQDHPSNPSGADESALPAKVVVMRRKTA
jgi:hypothetical protein